MSTILVADDKAGGRKALRDHLTKAKHNVIEAEDEDAAIERLRDSAIDLVLTDVRMKKPDGGMEVLRVARSEYPDIPSPIRAGVFGITRRIFAPSGSIFVRLSREIPAAIEIQSVSLPEVVSGATTCSIICGFTARRIISGSPLSNQS